MPPRSRIRGRYRWSYPLTTIHPGEETQFNDTYPVALWPRGKKGVPGVIPRLRVLTKPPADAKLQYQEHFDTMRIHEIPWSEFWTWMEAANLRLLRDANGIFHTPSQPKARLSPGDAARRNRWELPEPD